MPLSAYRFFDFEDLAKSGKDIHMLKKRTGSPIFSVEETSFPY